MTTYAAGGAAVPEWTVGDRLRKARDYAGLEQIEIAAELGISRVAVSRYETDVRRAPRSVLMSWGLVTGVSFHWLETGEAPPADDAAGDLEPWRLRAG